MNKYSKIYFNEIEKHAFTGALAAGAKNLALPAIKSTFSAAKPALSKFIPAAAKAVKDFSAGTIDGVSSMAKGYRAIAGSGKPLGKQISDMSQWTFRAPWQAGKSVLSQKPITQVTAKDIGTVAGSAVPGLGAMNAIDKGINSGLDKLEKLTE